MKDQNAWMAAGLHIVIVAIILGIIGAVVNPILFSTFGFLYGGFFTLPVLIIQVVYLVAVFIVTPISARIVKKQFAAIQNWAKVTKNSGIVIFILAILSAVSSLGTLNIIGIVAPFISFWIFYTQTQKVFGGASMSQFTENLGVNEFGQNVKGAMKGDGGDSNQPPAPPTPPTPPADNQPPAPPQPPTPPTHPAGQ